MSALSQAIDKLLASGVLKKRTRISRLEITYPLVYPYNGHHGLPTVTGTTPLRNVTDYSISENDTLAAAQLTLTAANSATGFYSAMAETNDAIRVEERYTGQDIAGADVDTGWFTVGTYWVDTIEQSAEPGKSTISIVCRDAFKWLGQPGFEEKLWADLIRVPKKRFNAIVVPGGSITYYVFADGTLGSHTFNWASPPVPRVWDPNDGRRISFQDGSIQVLYGTGELIIEKEFYESARNRGGLGNPLVGGLPKLDVQYARYCLPEDEHSYTVTAISGNTVTLSGGAVFDWQPQMTLVITSGNGKHMRFRVVSVDTGLGKATLERDPVAEGLITGDTVRIGESNRLETVIRRILVMSGFQDVDSTKPFYISQIEQSIPQLVVPTVDAFDFRDEKRSSGLAAYQGLLTILPPNLQLTVDADGDATFKAYTQQTTPQYTIKDQASEQQIDASDAEVFTAVKFYVRNRDPQNVAYIGNKPSHVASFTLYQSEPISSPGTGTSGHYLKLYGNVPGSTLQEQAKRAVLDARSKTAIALVDDNAGSSTSGQFDGVKVFDIVLDAPIRLKEIHVTALARHKGVDTSQMQYWQIDYTEDGTNWDPLGDEFNFSNGRKILTSADFGDNVTVLGVRFSVSQAAKWRVDDAGFFGIGSSTTKYCFAGIATVGIFADDIITGTAELGVDRFDLLTEATGVGSNYIDVLLPLESRCVGLDMLVKGKQYTISGLSGVRTFVASGNPSTDGIVTGNSVLVVTGERDSDFNGDIARRGRLGRRVYTVKDIDEVGYYIVQSIQNQGFAYTLADYAHDKAMEYLGEVSREFLPMIAVTVRPDARSRDTTHFDFSQQGVAADVYVREIQRDANGKVQIRATPFRDVAFRIRP